MDIKNSVMASGYEVIFKRICYGKFPVKYHRRLDVYLQVTKQVIRLALQKYLKKVCIEIFQENFKFSIFKIS